MNLQERADLYRESFPKFQPLFVIDEKRIEGIWIMGNDYRVKSGYYGGYPAGYLSRVMSMFPDRKNVLHLFAGKVEPGPYARCDINPDLNPDICGDAEKLSSVFPKEQFRYDPASGCLFCWKCGMEYRAGCVEGCKGHLLPPFDLILADPPYSSTDAEKYGTCMIKRNTVVKECLNVLKPGGFLVWLDQVFPLHRKAESPAVGIIYVREEFPELDLVGEIGMIKSTNHRVRAVFIFQKSISAYQPKDEEELPFACNDAFDHGSGDIF